MLISKQLNFKDLISTYLVRFVTFVSDVSKYCVKLRERTEPSDHSSDYMEVLNRTLRGRTNTLSGDLHKKE